MSSPAALLTTRQVADLLNVSPRTVTNWIRGERVPFVRLPGGEYRVPKEGLLQSLTGTHDLREAINVIELEEGTRLRRQAERRMTMAERLDHVAVLSKQMTSITRVQPS